MLLSVCPALRMVGKLKPENEPAWNKVNVCGGGTKKYWVLLNAAEMVTRCVEAPDSAVSENEPEFAVMTTDEGYTVTLDDDEVISTLKLGACDGGTWLS